MSENISQDWTHRDKLGLKLAPKRCRPAITLHTRSSEGKRIRNGSTVSQHIHIYEYKMKRGKRTFANKFCRTSNTLQMCQMRQNGASNTCRSVANISLTSLFVSRQILSSIHLRGPTPFAYCRCKRCERSQAYGDECRRRTMETHPVR